MRTRTKIAAGVVGGIVLVNAFGGGGGGTDSVETASGARDASSLSSPTASPSSAPSPVRSAPATPAAVPSAAAPAPAPSPTRAAAPPSPRAGAAAAPLLFAAANGDGDSWKDTQGREYRMGLINTPELNECYGQTASSRRKALVANGFRAQVYETDQYGRRVSVITLPDGRNLNVLLARTGFADDRFLAQFRSENPGLAAQLDVAFAAAKRERVGLWGACGASGSGGAGTGSTGGAAPAPPPQPAAAPATGCHPDYVTCVPVKGNGSGSGDANDLDCGDIRKQVTLRGSRDPYRLDSNGDGFGCESYG